MRFLYKIHSGYDGFSPKRIPSRLVDGKDLVLGWQRYLDSVEVGQEIWIYFHGPHKFQPGVYVRGFVRSINLENQQVRLRVRKWSTDTPLTDEETSKRIGEVVAVRYRQVFLFPEQWQSAPNCTIHTTAASCGQRICDNCTTWQGLPRIDDTQFCFPHRLPVTVIGNYVPAYWVIPSRCFLRRLGNIVQKVRQTSDIFMRFKTGEENLAYPLALGVFGALTARKLLDFDAVVPIPLSPDKEKAGEIHRTRLLSKELARLLGTRVCESLSLSAPISKHKLRVHQGLSATDFEAKYSDALRVDSTASGLRTILLVDDVCTEGSTLRCAVRGLRAVNPETQITVATAGQMLLKAVVKQPAAFVC